MATIIMAIKVWRPRTIDVVRVITYIVQKLAAVSYFAITFSIRTSKRNTLIANKIELN